jgi:hypothetical protein
VGRRADAGGRAGGGAAAAAGPVQRDLRPGWLTRLGRAHADGLRLGDPALLGIYRRQQELSWTEHLVERIERELEEAGALGRPGAGPGGRTVNLAARIAAHAGAGQVLVSQRVAESAPPAGVVFNEAGEVELKGFAHPVRLLEACRA